MTTSTLASVDRADMLGAIAGLPDQLPDGYRRAHDACTAIARAWPPESHAGAPTPRTLVICGMGGSGVGADLLPAVFDTRAPVVAVKGYDLPAWVTDEDCVVCVSYSGSTAETLSCFAQAMSRSVVAAVVTSGGELGSKAAANDIPVVPIPTGMQPRAAVGVLFGALAAVAEALNVVEHAQQAIGHASEGARTVVDLHTGIDVDDALARARDALGLGMDGSDGDDAAGIAGDPLPPALELARELHDAAIVIYGAAETVAIAHRWKAQINENGKVPAFANAYPELDHNEIVGWEFARATGGRWALVELALPTLSAALRQRMDVTRELVADALVADVRIEATHDDRAAAIFELVAWGDYVSVFLALLRGIDPSPVERIAELKRRLAGA